MDRALLPGGKMKKKTTKGRPVGAPQKYHWSDDAIAHVRIWKKSSYQISYRQVAKRLRDEGYVPCEPDPATVRRLILRLQGGAHG